MDDVTWQNVKDGLIVFGEIVGALLAAWGLAWFMARVARPKE